MSVANLICDSVFLLGLRRYESAMCLAMNALDATAVEEYGDIAVGERCRRFVRAHYDVISVIGTGGAIYSAPGSHLGVFDPQSGDSKSLEDVLYTLVRCSLTHKATLPPNTYFNEQAVFGKTGQGLSIPVHMIYAVILAVTGATTNAGQTTVAGTPDMIVMGQTIRLADCWGHKPVVLQALGISETTGLQAADVSSGIGVNHGTILNGKIGPNGVGMNKGTISGCTFDARPLLPAGEGGPREPCAGI